jgi:hypothetical protein
VQEVLLASEVWFLINNTLLSEYPLLEFEKVPEKSSTCMATALLTDKLITGKGIVFNSWGTGKAIIANNRLLSFALNTEYSRNK